MAYDVLGFLVTDKCNFTCRHCCNESQPKNSHVLDLDAVYRCIDEAKEAGGFEEIGISGGEPFLFQAYLSQIIAYAAQSGFSVQITTNCFWARSEEKAHQVLAPLAAKGLKCINISVSQFHLEFNKPVHLYHAAKAALDLGIITRVNCVCTQSFGVDDARSFFGECAGSIQFLTVPCLPTGRAALAIDPEEFSYRADIPHGSCARQFTRLAITAEGDVYPCCSPGGFTEPLKLGNMHDATIGEILAGTERNLLFHILESVGPSFFVPFIEERIGDIRGERGFVDPCHLCHTIMSNAATRQIVEDTIHQLDAELASLNLDIVEALA